MIQVQIRLLIKIKQSIDRACVCYEKSLRFRQFAMRNGCGDHNQLQCADFSRILRVFLFLSIIAEFVMFGMIWPMYSRCCFLLFFLHIIIINSPIDKTECSTWDLQLAGFFFLSLCRFLKVQKITFANWTTKMNYHLELTSGSFEKPRDAQEVNLRSLHSHLV